MTKLVSLTKKFTIFLLYRAGFLMTMRKNYSMTTLSNFRQWKRTILQCLGNWKSLDQNWLKQVMLIWDMMILLFPFAHFIAVFSLHVSCLFMRFISVFSFRSALWWCHWQQRDWRIWASCRTKYVWRWLWDSPRPGTLKSTSMFFISYLLSWVFVIL